MNIRNLKADSSICFGGTTEISLTTPTVMTSGVIRFDYTVSATGGAGIVTGNMAAANNLSPGHRIIFPYENNSDTIQSVYYSIRPKVVGLTCPAGNINTSEIKVHPQPFQQLSIPQTLTCDGGSDATLTAVLSRGASPYDVEWSLPNNLTKKYTTSEDTTDLENVKGGIYTVNVTDNLGCSNSDNTFVSGARLDSYLYVNPKSNGYGTTCPDPDSNDGELWIQETTNSTGIAPFYYSIVLNDTIPVISDTLPTTNVWQKHYGLAAGNYTLYITDSNECLNSDEKDKFS